MNSNIIINCSNLSRNAMNKCFDQKIMSIIEKYDTGEYLKHQFVESVAGDDDG